MRRLIDFIRRVMTSPMREVQERTERDQFPEEFDVTGKVRQ